MKFILATLVALIISAPSFAQVDPTIPIPTPDNISGVYFGVTFKQTLETKNSVLQAGYLFKVADKSYLSVGLDYDYDLDVSSIQPNFFYELKPRIYATAGLGLDFHNADLNNTAQLSGGFAYVPDYKFFGTMELAVVANLQYTGWVGIGSSAESGDRPVVIDNKTSGAEFWLSLIMLGF